MPHLVQNSCVCAHLRTCVFIQIVVWNWISEIFQISTSQAHLQYYKPTDIDLHPNIQNSEYILRCSLHLEIQLTFKWKPAGDHLWRCIQGLMCESAFRTSYYERAFRGRCWEVANCQTTSPKPMQGSNVDTLEMYNMVSAGMFFINEAWCFVILDV